MERAQEREQADADVEVARLYGLWREPGHGYRWAIVELPKSLVEKYLIEVAEPDLLSVTMGNLEMKMSADVMGLPDPKR